MCGRFAQYRGLADFLAELNSERGVISGYDNVPLARYNVAPSTRVHMLYGEARGIHLSAVRWGWAPHWAKPNLPPTINARVETVASGKYFSAIWPHRALIMADGWYEWVKDDATPQKKQPYFIKLKSGAPMFFAALGQYPIDEGEERDGDGVVIITQSSAGELLAIHDRQPVVLAPDASRRWIDPELTSVEAQELTQTQGLPAEAFTWYPVTKAVGNVKRNSHELIQPLGDLEQ
ncbi:MAG: SOS response-associated peptidase family protein [Pseudomonas sp.]